VTEEVDFDMTRFYAISAMVDLFEASELQALASFAATPEGRSALAKLSALGAVLNPIVERRSTTPRGTFGSADRARSTLVDRPLSFALPHLKRFGDPGYEPAGTTEPSGLGRPGERLSRGARALLVLRGAQWTAPSLPP
jgi:hypothetical protein